MMMMITTVLNHATTATPAIARVLLDSERVDSEATTTIRVTETTTTFSEIITTIRATEIILTITDSEKTRAITILDLN